MAGNGNPKLHWTQRIALLRHNLHLARRTNDFSFFRSLQAHALIEGTDYVALLYSSLGDNADSVLSTLDNLNAGIAYVHQDAFKAIYDSAKAALHANEQTLSDRRSLLRVDICQQRDMADHAIDKTTNSAINFIQSHPSQCQDDIANAWVTGTTIITDAVCICLKEMNTMEANLDDFIQLEYSWNCIQSSVDATVSALRGIFSLMGTSNTTSHLFAPNRKRNPSISSSIGSDGGQASSRSRNSSTASALSFIKRALSHSQIYPPPVTKAARTSSLTLSLPLPEANQKDFRMYMSNACPTKLSNLGDLPHTKLDTIPPTPSVIDVSDAQGDEVLGPFKPTSDYFSFDLEKKGAKNDSAESTMDDLMQIESLDPLCSPVQHDTMKTPVPLTLRSFTESFNMGSAEAISV